MPTPSDLTGLGMPPSLAGALGNGPQAVTCAGTAQTTATAIRVHNVELTAASSQTGAILPSNALVGTPYFCAGLSSTAAVVYCPVGHTLNGSANNSVTIAQNNSAIIWQSSKNQWRSLKGA